MLIVIITVREEVFPDRYCWTLEQCTTRAFQAAGWSAEPWAQKIVRLPPAGFTYHPGTNPASSAAIPKFVLAEALLSRSRSTAEKEAVSGQFRAAADMRLPTND